MREKTLSTGYSASYPTILNPVAQNNESNTNTRTALGDVTIKKVDKDDPTKVLSGAEFSLYKASDDTLVQDKITTGKDGTVELHNLMTGSNRYYLKETESPQGYVLPSDADNGFDLTIDTSPHTTITITNEQPKQTIQVTKIWDDNTNTDGTRPTAAEYEQGSYVGLVFRTSPLDS